MLQRPESEGSVSSGSEEESPRAMTTLESVASSMAASLAAVAALSGKPPSLYPPGGLYPWYLGPSEPRPSPPGPEQPLDLSKGSSKSPEPEVQHVSPTAVAAAALKMPPAALNRLYK